MLRKVRIVLAVVFFAMLTLCFLDFTGVIPSYFAWMAKVQFLPAVLSLNVVIVAILLLATLVFGRIYCSIVCPMGVMQDIIAYFRKKRKRNPYKFSNEKKWLRYTVLALFILAIILGINAFVALLAPYSAYGRIAATILQPIYLLGNNCLAYLAESVNSFAFYHVDIIVKSALSLVIATVTLLVIGILAWRGGRTYCNTICPVGTFLSIFSRFALVKIHINEDKCVSCGICARNCKGACIDSKNHSIDYSRCVVCGDCLPHCHSNALVYSLPQRKNKPSQQPHEIDTSRRAILLGATIATTTAILAQEQKKVDGGLAVIEDRVAPQRKTPISPPGSRSARNLQSHCTACQLCVAACPNNVLRPVTALTTFMQPTMTFDHGSCAPDCNKCSSVCPTSAIQPISLEEKASTQIGHAVWIKQNCVVTRDNVNCWVCSSHCPAGAITLIPLDSSDDDSLSVPAIDISKCIGCGTCEYLCAARPLSAIYVEGHEVHKEI